MPPKHKFSKSEIVSAAYELTRESGIDAVVARSVGKRLGTSSSPIFTAFNNMEDLKEEVRALAKQNFREYMLGVFDFKPAFKEFGMRWVRFASEEPNLYRLLFFVRSDGESPFRSFESYFRDIMERLEKEIMSEFALKKTDAEDLLRQMIVFANGFTAFSVGDSGTFSEEDASKALSRVCIALVITDKLHDGTLDLPMAKTMVDTCFNGTRIQKKE